MREIKFRAKPVYMGGRTTPWVYGTFRYIPCNIVSPGASDNGWRDLRNDKGIITDPYYCGETEVLCDTVGQFTGFRDADGRDIYEGDIFQVNGGPYHLIKWLDDLGGFGTCNLSSMRMLSRWPDRCLFGIPAQDWWRDFKHEIKVVGNIYDDPDFLEKFKEG